MNIYKSNNTTKNWETPKNNINFNGKLSPLSKELIKEYKSLLTPETQKNIDTFVKDKDTKHLTLHILPNTAEYKNDTATVKNDGLIRTDTFSNIQQIGYGLALESEKTPKKGVQPMLEEKVREKYQTYAFSFGGDIEEYLEEKEKNTLRFEGPVIVPNLNSPKIFDLEYIKEQAKKLFN